MSYGKRINQDQVGDTRRVKGQIRSVIIVSGVILAVGDRHRVHGASQPLLGMVRQEMKCRWEGRVFEMPSS